jgi:hypothetical protein
MFQAASGLTIPFITSHATQRNAAQATGLTIIWVEYEHVQLIHCDSLSLGARFDARGPKFRHLELRTLIQPA